MAFTLATALSGLKRKVPLPDERISEEDRLDAIRNAVEQYSGDRRRIIAEDVSGTGPDTFALPTDFVTGFSKIEKVETPIGNKPPVYVRENDDYQLIETASGTVIQFLSFTPDLPFRLVYDSLHTLQDLVWLEGEAAQSATTILRSDHLAFINLCAHMLCLTAAALFAGTRSNAIRSDVINYRSKEREWNDRAKAYLEAYDRHIKGNDEAATEIMDVDMPPLPGGLPRLWHTRRRT